MEDLISRADAIQAITFLRDCENGYSDVYDKAHIIRVLEEVPVADQQIIYCKDCAKFNKSPDFYPVYLCCPLMLIRGKAEGHEFDYQYCCYAKLIGAENG